MREIETKILEVDVKKTEKILKKLGAKLVFDGKIEFIRFKGLGISDDSLLRVRKVGDKVQLTFKKRNMKSRFLDSKEIETYVGDFNTTKDILLNLGFSIRSKGKKHRKSYVLGKTRFEFDTFKGIPTYLEIEGSEASIKKYSKLLGFKEKDFKNWTQFQVLRYYKA